MKFRIRGAGQSWSRYWKEQSALLQPNRRNDVQPGSESRGNGTPLWKWAGQVDELVESRVRGLSPGYKQARYPTLGFGKEPNNGDKKLSQEVLKSFGIPNLPGLNKSNLLGLQ